MIHNKTVFDLLQHRGEIFRKILIMGDTPRERHELSELTTDAFNILAESPSIVISEGDSKHIWDKEAMLSQAFVPDMTGFALPFPRFSIVLPADQNLVVLSVSATKRNDVNGLRWVAFTKPQNKQWLPYCSLFIEPLGKDTDGTAMVNITAIIGRTREDTQKEISDLAVRITATLGLVNNQGHHSIRMPIARKPGQSLQSICKSKALLEYREVKLSDVPGYLHVSRGGTHASPRWHERRGHWRQYRSGLKVWVKNSEVGKKSLGVVQHDYEVRA